MEKPAVSRSARADAKSADKSLHDEMPDAVADIGPRRAPNAAAVASNCQRLHPVEHGHPQRLDCPARSGSQIAIRSSSAAAAV